VAGPASKGVASAQLQDPRIGPSTHKYLSLSHKPRACGRVGSVLGISVISRC
jgi:hypothetical protein